MAANGNGQADAAVVSGLIMLNGVIMSGGLEVLLEIAEVKRRGFGRVIVFIENGTIDRADVTITRKIKQSPR